MKILLMFALMLCLTALGNDTEKLLDAIRIVESQNGRFLRGKNGETGPYHMKRVVIDDVNRILGKEVYQYEDALDEKKAREICLFYMRYWANRSGDNSIESMARIWNGGPRGNRIDSTIPYWNKIRRIIYGGN